MPRPVSLDIESFYGQRTPALSGRYRFEEPYFAIFGKAEQTEETAQQGQGSKTPKTFSVWPVVPIDGGDVIELRYSVGFMDRIVPGKDPETPAEGDGAVGPRGGFLVGLNDERDEHLSEEYDWFPRFWRSLHAAGAEAYMKRAKTEGIGVFAGCSVEFNAKIEKYQDRKTGEQKDGAPFNFAMAGSFQAAKAKTAGPKAVPGPKRPAGNAPAPKVPSAPPSADLAAGIQQVYEALVSEACDKILGGESITLKDLARRFVAINQELGGPVAGNGLIFGTQGIAGSGDYASLFAEVLAGHQVDGAATPLAADEKGNLSLAA